MADQKISSDSAATVRDDLIIPVVDLREYSTANQNKRTTWGELVDSIATYGGEVVVYGGNVVTGE